MLRDFYARHFCLAQNPRSVFYHKNECLESEIVDFTKENNTFARFKRLSIFRRICKIVGRPEQPRSTIVAGCGHLKKT